MPKYYFSDHKCCGRHVAPEYYSSPLTQKAAVEVLRALFRRWHQFTRDVGIDYWLVGGSLLGACRDGAIIPYDDDIDVAIDVKQLPRLVELKGTTSVTDRNGDWIPVYETADDVLRVSPRWQILAHEEDSKYWVDAKFVDKRHGLWVDILAYHEQAEGVFTRKYPLHGPLPLFSGGWLFPLSDIELESIVTRVPRRPESILKMRYGSNFATPDHVRRDGQWVRTTCGSSP